MHAFEKIRELVDLTGILVGGWIRSEQKRKVTNERNVLFYSINENKGEKIWCMVLSANKKTKPNLKPKLYNSLIDYPSPSVSPIFARIFRFSAIRFRVTIIYLFGHLDSA